MPRADVQWYSLYGRTCSTSLRLPEVRTIDGGGDVDFAVTVGPLGADVPQTWSHSVLADEGEEWLAFSEDSGTYWFRFLDSIVCRCRSDARGGWQVVIDDDGPSVPDATLSHLLIDEVFPMLLAISGSLVLHGAAVVLDGAAVVLLGSSGMGKSTLAAAFALSGTPVLSDDCVVIDHVYGGYLAQPSYPSIRVWSESADHLFGSATHGKPFAHYTDKRRYSRDLTFASEAAPLRGVVALEYGPRGEAGTTAMATMHGHAAAATVVSSAKNLPLGGAKALAVEALLDLADAVPVTRATLPDDLDQIDNVCAALRDWSSSSRAS